MFQFKVSIEICSLYTHTQHTLNGKDSLINIQAHGVLVRCAPFGKGLGIKSMRESHFTVELLIPNDTE